MVLQNFSATLKPDVVTSKVTPIFANANDVIQNLSGMAKDVQIIYKPYPFYLTWQFAVAVGLFIALVVLAGYAYFRISLRNRTNVIVHMPDRTRMFYSFKNFIGNEFNLNTTEKNKDGTIKKFTYYFRSDALETGFFGRYIEYNYKDAEPIFYKKSRLVLDYEFISALLNTNLAVDLLLSQDFKNFVKAMLIAIVVLGCIGIGIGIYTLVKIYAMYPATQGIKSCSISLTNETIESFKILNKL